VSASSAYAQKMAQPPTAPVDTGWRSGAFGVLDCWRLVGIAQLGNRQRAHGLREIPRKTKEIYDLG
jgi:hypothetical protein